MTSKHLKVYANAFDPAGRKAGRAQRQQKKLPESLRRRLVSYAAAAVQNRRWVSCATAAAVGVGVLAVAPAAEADVVYTSTNIILDAPQPGPTYLYPINVNSQAVLSFYAVERIGVMGWSFQNGVRAAAGNALVMGPLHAGYPIGPSAQFGGGGVLHSFGSVWGGITSFTFSGGPWAGSSGYIGMRFLIGGETHYGWVALSIPHSHYPGAVSGYAYDTVADESIRAGQKSVAPEPGTLGLLALGSLGLGYWRRKKVIGTQQ